MPTAPVLDDDALARLGEQLGDSDLLCEFLRDYLALLDQRIARLEHALTVADQTEWMDAVLSLKTSSTMAGARALAAQAADLQQESAACPSWCASVTPASAAPGTAPTRRTERMACLRRLAAETARQLRTFLQQFSGSHRAG